MSNLDFIRNSVTAEVINFILTNGELRAELSQRLDNERLRGKQKKILRGVLSKWGLQHNGTIGAIMIEELPLVKLKTVLDNIR